MAESVFIGVDVSCALKKRIPIVFALKREGRLVPLPARHLPMKAPYGHGNRYVIEHQRNLDYANAVRDYVVKVCNHFGVQPARIGVDSPLRPRSEALDYRIAERALNQAGISCYKTPSASEFEDIKAKARRHLAIGGALQRMPHAMQLWMLAGIEIARELATIAPVREVFPQANIRLLLPNVPHKSGKGVPLMQLQALAKQTGWPCTQEEWKALKQISAGGTHDQVDAYSAAWVASLPETDVNVFGDIQQQDAIWVPHRDVIKP
ncbi:DUF429 domain-containing protein [Pseudidiomarina woesei]|uniref:DUF429 domain-containing protein n=1 Tax=Pseudidiomarina woesei TaxID=1381080 RepID=A0A0K6GXI3_9GAMM|nr:DUF429 domain-containing protein [Pseudidiomarina woesei]CUA83208.1 Protein of unknown function (DUF429) [Pseudidiomarina woesei]